MADKEHSEHELLSRIAQGNEEAFAVVFKKYGQKIYGLAYHLTDSAVFAEEIVQDVFLKIWLKQEQLPLIGNFEAFLFIIARNHIYTYLKAIARHRVVHNEIDAYIPSDNTPETLLFYKEYAELIGEAVRQLPGQQLQVYRLSREEGRSREQIAAALDISPETVKVHLSRAMRSIRAFVLSRMPVSLLWVALLLLK